MKGRDLNRRKRSVGEESLLGFCDYKNILKKESKLEHITGFLRNNEEKTCAHGLTNAYAKSRSSFSFKIRGLFVFPKILRR